MKKLVCLILILSIFISCGQKQERGEKIVEDGIEVVINRLQPYKIKGEPSTFTLEEELSIDFSADEIGDLGIADANNFEVASDGTIYYTYPHKSDELIFQFDD